MTILIRRSFPSDCLGGGSEALWGRALPQIVKMRFGSCAGEVAFPRSAWKTVQLRLMAAEDKKIMWHGRENIVAYGRLPSPVRW